MKDTLFIFSKNVPVALQIIILSYTTTGKAQVQIKRVSMPWGPQITSASGWIVPSLQSPETDICKHPPRRTRPRRNGKKNDGPDVLQLAVTAKSPQTPSTWEGQAASGPCFLVSRQPGSHGWVAAPTASKVAWREAFRRALADGTWGLNTQS